MYYVKTRMRIIIAELIITFVSTIKIEPLLILNKSFKLLAFFCNCTDLGPVVQNFVSLTLLLSPQFVDYIST